MKRGLLLMLALGGATVLLGSCSHGFEIRPVGSLQGTLVFRFYDDSGRARDFGITDFALLQRTIDGRWSPVWAVAGEKTWLREIRYGAKYAGLKLTAGPKPLTAGRTYAASASDGSGGLGGSKYFRFTRDGAIVFLTSLDSPP